MLLPALFLLGPPLLHQITRPTPRALPQRSVVGGLFDPPSPDETPAAAASAATTAASVFKWTAIAAALGVVVFYSLEMSFYGAPGSRKWASTDEEASYRRGYSIGKRRGLNIRRRKP